MAETPDKDKKTDPKAKRDQKLDANKDGKTIKGDRKSIYVDTNEGDAG